MFRSRAEDKVKQAGFDPQRLPPGQYLTEKWPVLHAGHVPAIDSDRWELRIWGAVENPVTLTFKQLTALPVTEVVRDIHCVTRWSRFDLPYRGVHWRDLAALVRPTADALFAVAHADQGYSANVPVEAIEDDGALICWEADGAPLTPDHGFPVRLMIPSKYFWKSTKWLTGIELLAHDRPGFWERYGYNNNADYGAEERYAGF